MNEVLFCIIVGFGIYRCAFVIVKTVESKKRQRIRDRELHLLNNDCSIAPVVRYPMESLDGFLAKHLTCPVHSFVKDNDQQLVVDNTSVVDVIMNFPVLKFFPPEWFKCDWGSDAPPSPAEQKIIDELSKYFIHWEREVSFRTLQLATGGWSRFDFYLPDLQIAIEYDGKLWHQSPERKAIDQIKEQFCIDNNIELIRYNSRHYYHLDYEIATLMERLKIQPI